MKIAFYTLGCKVNTYDTESVWQMFEKAGYERVDFHDVADVYVINTCTVTNQADSKSRKMVRQAIRRNEGAVIVVMGCYAQVAADDLAEIDGVDLIVGTKNRSDIFKYVKEILKTRQQIIAVTKANQAFEQLKVDSYVENTRAFLKIQDGCNEFCSYCIIPYARGSVVSKSMDQCIKEAKELVENGYKEIVLTGIHTGQYGVDMNLSLTELVEKLIQIEGLHRLRISSIEINELTDELIELTGTSPVLANHFHIPLQAGSNQVLADMNRHYTVEEYKARLEEIRDLNPDIAITADVIVGYPTETEELFIDSLNFIESCKFSELHIFPYSKRNGTPAAKLKDHSNSIKQDRVSRLMTLNDKLAIEYRKSQVGKSLDLIVEHTSPLRGHTSNYIMMELTGTEEKNSIVVGKLAEANYPISQAVRTD